MDSKAKLRRFCYIGSYEPVYEYNRKLIDVSVYWHKMNAICKQLDHDEMFLILKDTLLDQPIVRPDEPVFAYAVYLMSDVDLASKLNLRNQFPVLIATEKNLFLFLYYVKQIHKFLDQLNFNRTVEKAVRAWYKQNTANDSNFPYMQRCGYYGFTHKTVIQLFRITDKDIGDKEMAKIFFKKSEEIFGEYQKNHLHSKVDSTCSTDEVEADAVPDAEMDNKLVKRPAIDQDNESKRFKAANHKTDILMASTVLKFVKSETDAYDITRKFDLPIDVMPNKLKKNALIISHFMPKMSYKNLLLKHIHKMTKHPEILQQAKIILCNSAKMQEANLHPVVYLSNIYRNQVTSDRSKKRCPLILEILRETYYLSFGKNSPTGLRFHITINLQKSYRRKILKSLKGLKYYEAALSLAFGYYKVEKDTDVWYWDENDLNLKPIKWYKDMNFSDAKVVLSNIRNIKNKQHLIAPIKQALTTKKVYDVFLAIVPTAGRNNPGQSPNSICSLLQQYRNDINPHAKYVIVDLMKVKKSMNYPVDENLNLLEICGLDMHTANIIEHFIMNRFN